MSKEHLLGALPFLVSCGEIRERGDQRDSFLHCPAPRSHTPCLTTALPAPEPSSTPHLPAGRRRKIARVGFFFYIRHQIPFLYNLVSFSQALKVRDLWEAASKMAPVIPTSTSWQSPCNPVSPSVILSPWVWSGPSN